MEEILIDILKILVVIYVVIYAALGLFFVFLVPALWLGFRSARLEYEAEKKWRTRYKETGKLS